MPILFTCFCGFNHQTESKLGAELKLVIVVLNSLLGIINEGRIDQLIQKFVSVLGTWNTVAGSDPGRWCGRKMWRFGPEDSMPSEYLLSRPRTTSERNISRTSSIKKDIIKVIYSCVHLICTEICWQVFKWWWRIYCGIGDIECLWCTVSRQGLV